MKKKIFRFLKTSVIALMLLSMLLCGVACGEPEEEPVDWAARAAELQGLLDAANASNTDLTGRLSNAEANASGLASDLEELEAKLNAAEETIKGYEKYPATHEYDFYMTLGTLPTLYATLNAYEEKNPNTYMWFYRGNTISYEYTAEHIHYFSTQSQNNGYSEINYTIIRDKIKEIMAADPKASFNLYCDDLRVAFVLQFVYCGIEFEDLDVVLLSDGTGTYDLFKAQTDAAYAGYAAEWEGLIAAFKAGRDDPNFTSEHMQNGDQADRLRYLAFYVSTFPNVEYWVQHKQYLRNESADYMAKKDLMNIVLKNPRDMYLGLDDETRAAYQKVVLANSLVGSTTLTTLDDAVAYFDSKLGNRDKEVVLILGSSWNDLERNQPYMDQAIAFYTPTRDAGDATKVLYKGKQYTVDANATTVTVDGKALTIGELGVYLFFKGHPAYPANDALQSYFASKGIEILPHRTPVETLFWLYDVKAGGYQSTSFLSAQKGQTEFFFGDITTAAVLDMIEAGFFEGAAFFTA